MAQVIDIFVLYQKNSNCLFAYAGQGKWVMARDSFKRVEATVAALPVELQRVALKSEVRAAIEVGDFAGAADELNDLETIGLPHELQPSIAVLVGRLSEGMGRNEDALAALSQGGGLLGPPGGGAGAAARDRAALRAWRSQARGRSFRSGNAHHDLAR
jgi:hypothetical protein